MEYEELSVDEIERHLEEIQQNQAELQRVLKARREEGKQQVAQEVQALVQDRGYKMKEILPLLKSRGRRSVQNVTKMPKRTSKIQYVDPDNPKNIYSRGVIPGWMKNKMVELGYDPSVKDQRDAFKAKCLDVIQA